MRRIPFREGDFSSVRDFLVETYNVPCNHPNWLLDRWNFVRFFGQSMHETYAAWPNTVGYWLDDDERIAAVVHSEGENRGEAFFQLRCRTFTDAELQEFLAFAEENLAVHEDGSTRILLRVGQGFAQLQNLAAAAGYQKLDWSEPTASVAVTGPYAVELPQGFRISDARHVADFAKGFAHGKAFGYYKNDQPDDDDAERAFRCLRLAPDYRPELDLVVVNDQEDVAAFACIWLDAQNRIAILEPVGTVPQFQRLGLAKAVVYEGIGRAASLGAQRVYVGSDQAFYRAIGFEVDYVHEVWEKVLV